MATRRNIYADQYASLELHYVWSVDGVPVNLTGWSAKMEVRQNYTANVALTASTANGRITLSSVGNIDVFVDGDDMDMTAGVYFYDILLESGSGAEKRFIEGKMKVRPGVTRDV